MSGYINKWMFHGKHIKNLKDIPEGLPFFVYKVTFKNDDFYIGCKQIYSITNVKLSKKRANELWSGKGRKPVREKKIRESDWKTYKTSSKIVQERLAVGEKAEFIIIDFFENKKTMLLYEAWLIIEQFINNNPKCLNSWVSIKQHK